ncbi:alpha/beta hydrolase [Natronomonas gomsonensis]|uniref:alpha/beta fold hydrolase n=1 Tax=Natronomonas gomsonensis TaxID=1046043 RepID=UPI0020CA6E0A|nr:alpha/beta hydrolase [Natronomonas gomsonensis]MCY4729215.1 alpha/beta hydrolase [Natronomonas gomsonensis]
MSDTRSATDVFRPRADDTRVAILRAVAVAQHDLERVGSGATEDIARINRAIEQYSLPDSLDIDAPVLLLTRTEGPPHLQDGVRAVDAALSNSQLVEFESVGHGGPTEAPDRVMAAVRDFIDETETPVPESGN